MVHGSTAEVHNMRLPEGWKKACVRSMNAYKEPEKVLKQGWTCKEGKPCEFIRIIPMRGIIYISCIFNRCVKIYPTREDLYEEMEKPLDVKM